MYNTSTLVFLRFTVCGLLLTAYIYYTHARIHISVRRLHSMSYNDEILFVLNVIEKTLC